jgi:hypothetical protein
MKEAAKVKGKVAWVCIGLAVVLLIHHKITSGVWFNIEDVTNHEFLEIALVAFGLGILIGKRKGEGVESNTG